MSATPRTDKFIRESTALSFGCGIADFARQLECEIAEAKEKSEAKDGIIAAYIEYNRCVALTNPLADVLASMRLRGGSFVLALADCFRYADPENRQRLMNAFPAIMERYDAMAGRQERSEV